MRFLLERSFSAADDGESEAVVWAKWAQALQEKLAQDKTGFRIAFQQADADRSGTLKRAEFLAGMERLQASVPQNCALFHSKNQFPMCRIQ